MRRVLRVEAVWYTCCIFGISMYLGFYFVFSDFDEHFVAICNMTKLQSSVNFGLSESELESALFFHV